VFDKFGVKIFNLFDVLLLEIIEGLVCQFS